MFHQKSFSNDIINIYNTNPSALSLIFQYNLVKGSITKTDDNNNNILHLAVSNNDNVLVRAIINYILYVNQMSKYILNQQNNNGDIPMHIAVRLHNDSIAELLHRAGSDLSIENNNGEAIESSESNEDKIRCIDNIKSNNTYNDDIETTDFFAVLKDELKNVDNNFNDIFIVKEIPHDLQGGAKNASETSFDIVPMSDNLNWNNIIGGSKETDKQHKEVSAKCIKLMNNDETDGKAFKKALWKKIKDEHPGKSGNERTEILVKLVDKFIEDPTLASELKKQVPEMRKIMQEATQVAKEQKAKLNKSDKKNKTKDKPDKKNKTNKTKDKKNLDSDDSDLE